MRMLERLGDRQQASPQAWRIERVQLCKRASESPAMNS